MYANEIQIKYTKGQNHEKNFIPFALRHDAFFRGGLQ
jgi:hypothetical protein